MMKKVDETLEEREGRYGSFDEHARITQAIKAAMELTPNWQRLSNAQREALEMIAHKIGRVLNGDPGYVDNFRDIAGYAQLVVNILEGTDGASDSKNIYMVRRDGIWEVGIKQDGRDDG